MNFLGKLFKLFIIKNSIIFIDPLGLYCLLCFNDFFFGHLKALIAIIVLIIAWTPLTIVYVWPIFGKHENLPVRLSGYAPPFAKLTALVIPMLLKEC